MLHRFTAFLRDPSPAVAHLPAERHPARVFFEHAVVATTLAAGATTPLSSAHGHDLSQHVPYETAISEQSSRPAADVDRSPALVARMNALSASPASAAVLDSNDTTGADATWLARSIESVYARYLVQGRSNGEVEFDLARTRDASGRVIGHNASFEASADAPAGVRIEQWPTGTCTVSGVLLNNPQRQANQADQSVLGLANDRVLQALRAHTIIHEVTHCQVTQAVWAMGMRVVNEMAPGREAYTAMEHQLLQNAIESISDARGVIEVARKDGSAIGASLADALIAEKEVAASRNSDPAQDTVLALQRAMKIVVRDPMAIRTDEQAFRVAVQIGAQSALPQILGNPPERAGRAKSTKAIDPVIQRLHQELGGVAAALASEFKQGRFPNDAIRVVTSAGRYDYDASADLRSPVGTFDVGARTMKLLRMERASGSLPSAGLRSRPKP